ncbi:alpha/beta hydrolase [Pseudonocardia sp. CA-142604]|uniref:alpha/beta hydrolase n=1 Tax=Pseudonocardia sp. CA-142604 TaxID=3240024 RepID=UPI003D8FB652
MPQPTIVFVHGAFHGPWAWDAVIRELPDLPTRTVALPSSGHDPATLGDMYSDAAAIREAVTAIEAPVLVMAHSYGGVPATEGLAGLAQVSRLVYLASFQLDVGDSLFSAAGGKNVDWWDVHEAEGYFDALRPEEVFFADVDEAATQAAVARLGHQSWPAITQPLTRAAWHAIPSTYVVCENDVAIPLPAQEAMAQRSERVLRLQTSHSPFLSRPADVASILRAEVASITA